MRVNIVMYHYVRNLGRSRYPAIKGLDADLFRRQLNFLKANFTIIRMEDMLNALCGGKLSDNAALLTFDDGYIDHYTSVFPLLDDMGIQGSFFPPGAILESNMLLDVNKIHFILASANVELIYQELLKEICFHRGTEFAIPDEETLLKTYAVDERFDGSEIVFIKRMLQTVLPERLRAVIAGSLFRRFVDVDEEVLANELYCDATQLATMKKHGMFIGLHGFNHDWLGNMDKLSYEKDICQALDYMENARLIDKNAWVMNYPYGSWNNGVVEFISTKGCQAGLTTFCGIADTEHDNRFLLPRLDTNDYFPKSDNHLNF